MSAQTTDLPDPDDAPVVDLADDEAHPYELAEPDGFDMDHETAVLDARDHLAELVAERDDTEAQATDDPDAKAEALAKLDEAITAAGDRLAELEAESLQLELAGLTDERTGWAMYRLRKVLDEIDRVDGTARARHAHIDEWVRQRTEAAREQIDRWHEGRSARLARERHYFEGLLTALATDEFRRRLDAAMPAARKNLGPDADEDALFREAWAKVKGGKTLSVPEGDVSATISRHRVEITDRERFLEWAQELGHDELLRWKPEPDMDEIKARVRRAEVLGDEITVLPFDRTRAIEIAAELAEAEEAGTITDRQAEVLAILRDSIDNGTGEVPDPEAVPGVQVVRPSLIITVKPER